MKWMKKNKFTVTAIFVFILLVFLGYKIVDTFFPNQGTAVYGDRLDGKVMVEQSIYDEVKQKISENKKVENVSLHENGRRIDITILVANSTGKNEAKKLVDNILEPFTESQIGYYDFQVFIKKEDTSENDFPIIGYKHHNSSTFSWTKDREKTEEAGTK